MEWLMCILLITNTTTLFTAIIWYKSFLFEKDMKNHWFEAYRDFKDKLKILE